MPRGSPYYYSSSSSVSSDYGGGGGADDEYGYYYRQQQQPQQQLGVGGWQTSSSRGALRAKSTMSSGGRGREMRRKARLLMTLMMLVGSLQAVAIQGNYDDFKALYLQGVSPTTLMWCETLIWVALCFLMWYIHGALSSEDDARGEIDDLHEMVKQQTEVISLLSERLEYFSQQQQATTEAITSSGSRL